MAQPEKALRSGAAAAKAPGDRNPEESRTRDAVARIFTFVEDLVYIGLGILLAGTSVFLLGVGVVEFVQQVLDRTLAGNAVGLLDRILLILMIVEVLYTVQVSFREHALVPEPFLIVGLIAATRRVLVLTAEFSKLAETGEAAFRNAMIELGLLTVMIVALVVSLVLLRRRAADAVAERG